jgi:hypothetical protein
MLLAVMTTHAQVVLDSVGREVGYVQTIVTRAGKIVDELHLTDSQARANVQRIIANRYFTLSDMQAKQTSADQLNANLYLHHFEFEAALANYLNAAQIEAVKDGMTYGVVPKTYQAYQEMIPTLKDNEKLQILNWLKEAREFAIDAGDSKSKHAWFGKYKGRINNWLSKLGYDLTQERKAWGERIAEKKK